MIHATAVAHHGPHGWRAVLLRGASGVGKSDLALRLTALPRWRLIGDDYVHVWVSCGGAFVAAVPALAGRIEARGLGIVDVGARTACRVALVVDCVREAVERLPEPAVTTIADVETACLVVDTRPASATRIVALAMDGFNPAPLSSICARLRGISGVAAQNGMLQT